MAVIMKNKINNELKNGFLLISFGIVLFISLEHFEIAWNILKGTVIIFSPFLLGLVIAFILNVPMNMIEKKLNKIKKLKSPKIKRGISIISSIIAVLLLLFFVVALIIPDIGKTVTSFINQIPELITNIDQGLQDISKNYPMIEEWANKIEFNPETMKLQFENWVKTIGSGILSISLNIVVSLINKLANFFIAFIFAIYVLAEKEKLASQFKLILSSFVKEKYVSKFFEVTYLANRTFSKFISGQCLEACILGILCFLGMSFFQFPYSLSISVLVALTALIPVFGAFIAMGVGALLISMVSFQSAFWFVVFFLILQQFEGNLIYPKVVGNSVGLPAIWTMMAVTIGGSCFGIPGMLISVPLSSIAYALLKDYIKNKNQSKKVF